MRVYAFLYYSAILQFFSDYNCQYIEYLNILIDTTCAYNLGLPAMKKRLVRYLIVLNHLALLYLLWYLDLQGWKHIANDDTI